MVEQEQWAARVADRLERVAEARGALGQEEGRRAGAAKHRVRTDQRRAERAHRLARLDPVSMRRQESEEVQRVVGERRASAPAWKAAVEDRGHGDARLVLDRERVRKPVRQAGQPPKPGYRAESMRPSGLRSESAGNSSNTITTTEGRRAAAGETATASAMASSTTNDRHHRMKPPRESTGWSVTRLYRDKRGLVWSQRRHPHAQRFILRLQLLVGHDHRACERRLAQVGQALHARLEAIALEGTELHIHVKALRRGVPLAPAQEDHTRPALLASTETRRSLEAASTRAPAPMAYHRCTHQTARGPRWGRSIRRGARGRSSSLLPSPASTRAPRSRRRPPRAPPGTRRPLLGSTGPPARCTR